MTIIYRQTDLIDIKIGDLLFKIKPLTYQERIDVLTTISNQSGNIVENAAQATYKLMKNSIQEVHGAKLIDGSDYKISKDESGKITEDSINDLLNIAECRKLGLSLHNFLQGIPEKLIDPNTGNVIEGVEIIRKEGVPKK